MAWNWRTLIISSKVEASQVACFRQEGIRCVRGIIAHWLLGMRRWRVFRSEVNILEQRCTMRKMFYKSG